MTETKLHDRYQITRAAESKALAEFCDFVERVCKQHPEVSEQTIYDLQLAVDEACANIVTHGYTGMAPGAITLALELSPRQVIVTIKDSGRSFEPKEPAAPDRVANLEERRVGGLGLLFIYKKMDEVSYETTADGNRMTLVKRL
ncbi:MAG: ATP-binding protein [Anaerolineales bacterium]|nr:ATP-binding protein [Anaerolineales bacterium]